MTQSTFAVSLQSVNHIDRGNGIVAALEQEFGRGHGSQRHNSQRYELQRYELQRYKLQHIKLRRCKLQDNKLQDNKLQGNKLQRHDSQLDGLRDTWAPTDGKISMRGGALADNGLDNVMLTGITPGSMMFGSRVSGSMVSGNVKLFNKALPLLGAGGLTDIQSGGAVALRQTSGRYRHEVTVLTEH